MLLSVHSNISKSTSTNFTQFSVHVTYGRGSVLSNGNAIFYVLSVFVDNVVFSYNAGNRPESKMTSMFRRVRQMAEQVRHQATFGRSRSPSSGTGGEVCLLRLHLALSYIGLEICERGLDRVDYIAN